jgi:hypothetical protein
MLHGYSAPNHYCFFERRCFSNTNALTATDKNFSSFHKSIIKLYKAFHTNLLLDLKKNKKSE